MVKAQTASYKLDDVLIAMRKMWGGDSLSKRDAEKRKGHSATKTFVATAESSWTDEPHEDHATAWMNTQDGEPNDSEDDLEESQAWFDQASTALADKPTDPAVLANFQEARKNFYKEARRALDKHRVARGFYPSEKGKGKEGANKGFQGRCMRCGKIGHKAMQCKQSLSSSAVSPGPSGGKGADAGRVGFVFAQTAADDHWIADRVTWASTDEIYPLHEPNFAALTDEINTKAIMDCGASESIIGAFTLQTLYDQYVAHGLDPDREISIDRMHRRSFVFGNNETSQALGYAVITAGIAGHNLRIPVHVVEGQTPMLLSSRWLEEHEAVINFRTGEASFKFLGDENLKLERASTNHLLLPMTSFDPQSVSNDVAVPENNGNGSESHCEAFANRPSAVPH